MEKGSASSSVQLENLPQTVMVGIVLAILLGIFLTSTTDELVAYLLILIAAAAPAAVWIRSGATGIPIMASISIFYFVYYGVPILRKGGDLSQYDALEILSAAVTVSLFLLAL